MEKHTNSQHQLARKSNEFSMLLEANFVFKDLRYTMYH